MVLLAFFCCSLRYEGVEVSPISSVSPVEDLEEMEDFNTQKNETIAQWDVNEVIKKASTLTANEDPKPSGRSLFRGLAFLSTAPTEGHIFATWAQAWVAEFLCLSPIFSRCHTGFALEELGEKGGIVEAQVHAYLVNGLVGETQQHLGALDCATVNPFHDGLS